MKATIYIAAVLPFLVSGMADAVTNPAGVNRVPQPNISNPAGMGRVPPSTYYQPYRPSNDIYAGGGAGNLIVTGDVAGGRQFRGVVPYSSVSGLAAPTGTEGVDAFLKETQRTGYGWQPGPATPYYSQSETVSRLSPSGEQAYPPTQGTPGLVGPLQPPKAKSTELNLQQLAQEYRPLSRTPGELVDTILRQSPASETETSLLKAINDVRQKELAQELQELKDKADELAARDTAPTEQKSPISVEPVKPLGPEFPETGVTAVTPATTEKAGDIYDKMLQQLDKDFDEYMRSREGSKDEGIGERGLPAPDAGTSGSGVLDTSTGGTGTQTSGGISPDKGRLSAILQAGRTGRTLDLDQLNTEGYKLYMDLGAEYMKQSKYYRAAEVYGLARVYLPDKAESYAGQGWALFATGEYMSSAYYLGKAIELDPNAAAKKIDLNDFIGQDRVKYRLNDLQQWQKRMYSSEMQFLLAYAYYQMGNRVDAEDEIKAASVKLEGYAPATILRDIILGDSR